MRKWEDIVKDKMEEPEGALPESVFAEFCARWEAAMAVPSKRRFPLVWAVVPAVAAGLAAVLLLHKPSMPEGDIQIIQQPLTTVAVVADTTTVNEPEQTTPLIARAVKPKVERPADVKPQEVRPADVKPQEVRPADVKPQEVVKVEITENSENTEVDENIENVDPVEEAERVPTKPVTMKVGPATGIIAGGGLLATIIPPALGAGTTMEYAQEYAHDGRIGIGNADHYFPLKMGLSVRFPLNDRLSFTTGLNYTWYRSSFTYSLSGEKIQNAHYLGIPVRLDWTLASNKWLDIYVGGGFEGDFCLGATLAGERIAKDAFCASLLGAGGIQFNLTKRFGVYVEPALSCTITPENPVPETYRTKHPLMFSVSSGLRITIGH